MRSGVWSTDIPARCSKTLLYSQMLAPSAATKHSHAQYETWPSCAKFQFLQTECFRITSHAMKVHGVTSWDIIVCC